MKNGKVKAENITEIDKELFKIGYVVSEYYKGLGIAFYTIEGYTYYSIVKDGCILKDMLISRQSAKYNITKLLKKGVA